MGNKQYKWIHMKWEAVTQIMEVCFFAF